MELVALMLGLLLLGAIIRSTRSAPVQEQEQAAAAAPRRRRTTTRRKPLRKCAYCGKAIRGRASTVLGNAVHGKCALGINDL